MAKLNKAEGEVTKAEFVFGKNNYKWFLIGIGVLALGYVLLSGSTDVFSFRKITLAPIMIVGGFVVIGYATLLKPSDNK